MPIDFAVAITFGTPAQRIVLNAGMLKELPSASFAE